MLSIFSDERRRNCDGFSRRELLKIGTGGLGGLLGGALCPELLRGGSSSEGSFLRDKAVVVLFLGGGPSHIETFNPNMDQPAPHRSLTGEVQTNLPGVSFGGTFPQLARHADKLAIVRSFHHRDSNHGTAVPYVLTGGDSFSGGMGAVYSRLRGANHPQTGMPTTAVVTAPELGRYRNPTRRVVDGSQPGGIGAAYAPFNPQGDSPVMENMKLNLPAARFNDRRSLLSALDQLRWQNEAAGSLSNIPQLRQQAYDLILGAAAEAFDLSREPTALIERYDTSANRVGEKEQDKRDCTLGTQLLLARRLIEAGCGFVTVSNAGWDMHAGSGNNGMSLAAGMRMLGASVDRAVSAFLEDLQQRGLSEKVLLVVTGEFGRSPRVNKNGGRDHWANLSTLALAGGGWNVGQVVGQSARKNDVPQTEPIGPENLMATIMHTLFDIGRLRLVRGVPREILAPLEQHAPIPGLA